MNDTSRVVVKTDYYILELDFNKQNGRILSRQSHKYLFDFGIDSAVDTLTQEETIRAISLKEKTTFDDHTQIILNIHGSNIWQSKQIIFELYADHLFYSIKIVGDGQRINNLRFLHNRRVEANTSEFEKVYVPRFDWTEAQVIINNNQHDSLSCQQWLSPPPFAYGFLSEQECITCGVAAKQGEYNFLSFDYNGEGGPRFALTYEGHTVVDGEMILPSLMMSFGIAEKNDALARYIELLKQHQFLDTPTDKSIPAWWYEPIFCGWGQMRYDYRRDHDGHENGNFINVTYYCTEQIYRNYIETMDSQQINPGTIIIDMGWAEYPALHTPSKNRWHDLRTFIDEQHQRGRKVLLWYTPVVTSGLPIEACMTLHGKPVCPDPTSPAYQAILADEIYYMISDAEGCLNADGFKIDFTQNTPSENGRFISYINDFWGLINEENDKYLYPPLAERTELIQTHGNKWGVEILRAYIDLIYQNMKKHKADSVLITHTANPYFADVVDILRLNDLDGNCQDVLGVMQNRARIARMCNPNWLIDTDNDLMIDKDRWRKYIQLQPELGIPDTYYISAIANSCEIFDTDDYNLLRQIWATYREQIYQKNAGMGSYR